MGLLTTLLEFEVADSAVAGDKSISITKHNSLFVFNDLVEKIKHLCDASVEEEAGGAIHNEWQIVLKSRGRRVAASWNWWGITFSARDAEGWNFLKEIEGILTTRKYYRLQLVLAEKLG